MPVAERIPPERPPRWIRGAAHLFQDGSDHLPAHSRRLWRDFGLATNKALATTEEEMNALKAIANNKCFATQEEARKYLPAFFQCDDFPYFTLIDGSSIKVTYAVAEEAPEKWTTSKRALQNIA